MTETPTGGPGGTGGGLFGAITNASTKTKAIAGSVVGLLVIAIIVIVAVAAGGDDKKKSAETSAPAPSTSSVVTPTPTPTTTAKPAPKPAAVDPLTGGPLSKNAVWAVKVADTSEARPQVNIDKADIVFVEQVEGGLTRLAAIYHSNIPDRIEPIRSVRPQDLEMVAQFGKIGFVASGGSSHTLSLVKVSPFAVSMEDFGSPGFRRDGSRQAPYNVIANLHVMKKGTAAKSIGWTFNAASSGAVGAKPATAIHTRVGQTPVDFTYSAATKRWIRLYRGAQDKTAAGEPIAAQNVIVQFCGGYYQSQLDPAGNRVWYTTTKGSGPVAVYRDGQRIDGTWSRPSLFGGTSLRDAKGHPIALKPGKTWVLLVSKGAPLS